MQTFRSGGKGGQNQNARDTGVRFIHPPSGASGESRSYRTQLANKREAFVRMAQSNKFQTWCRTVVGGLEESVWRAVERQMKEIEVEEGPLV